MTSRVRDLGEFELIDRLLSVLPEKVKGTDAIHGAGDDCAYWTPGEAGTVVTSDAMVEGVHFRHDWTDWRSLGHKIIAVNLSDLASMGCRPTVVITTLALTGDEQVSDLEDMYRGSGDLAAVYDVVIAGGDIVRTSGPVVISITAIGEQPGDREPMLRSKAKPGDVVLVSGTLGASAAGLRLLEQGGSSATTADLLTGAHLRPAPRVSLGQVLVEHGVRCCMDISDGLAGDLPKILNASAVGAEVRLDDVPVLPAVRALFPQNWMDLALHGGEDYELLCTASPFDLETLITAANAVGSTLTPIGVISEGPDLVYLDKSGGRVDVQPGAWDHFGNDQASEK